MKRMVENSEKIEELAEAVENSKTTLTFKKQVNFNENVNVHGVARYNNGLEVNNGDLVTSNITTTDGYTLQIFTESSYILSGQDAIGVIIMNLGTALIVTGDVTGTTSDGEHKLLNIKSRNPYLFIDMISNGDECKCYMKNTGNNSYEIGINFEQIKAYTAKPEYHFSFIIGYGYKQI